MILWTFSLVSETNKPALKQYFSYICGLFIYFNWLPSNINLFLLFWIHHIEEKRQIMNFCLKDNAVWTLVHFTAELIRRWIWPIRYTTWISNSEEQKHFLQLFFDRFLPWDFSCSGFCGFMVKIYIFICKYISVGHINR